MTTNEAVGRQDQDTDSEAVGRQDDNKRSRRQTGYNKRSRRQTGYNKEAVGRQIQQTKPSADRTKTQIQKPSADRIQQTKPSADRIHAKYVTVLI